MEVGKSNKTVQKCVYSDQGPGRAEDRATLAKKDKEGFVETQE